MSFGLFCQKFLYQNTLQLCKFATKNCEMFITIVMLFHLNHSLTHWFINQGLKGCYFFVPES